MASNDRIYFPMQQIAIARNEAGGWIDADVVRGVQSVSTSTNFNIVALFQLGQQEIYETVEEVPDIEISASKVLDGSPLLYHLATNQAAGGEQTPTLAGRAAVKCDLGMSFYNETDGGALTDNTPTSSFVCTGMVWSTVSYNFSTTDNFMENITLVNNDKVWYASPADGPSGVFATTTAPVGSGGVNRRENLMFDFTAGGAIDVNDRSADPDATILPISVFGITSSGTNELADGKYGAHIQSISVSVNSSRDLLTELGQFGPYVRTLNYPIEVTTDIEVLSTSGDRVSATEAGIYVASASCAAGNNLVDETIRIATCEGTRVYTGAKNKLRTVNYGGGDTGGGNATVTYSYVTWNDFTVLHSSDPNGSGTAWWAARSGYLCDMP